MQFPCGGRTARPRVGAEKIEAETQEPPRRIEGSGIAGRERGFEEEVDRRVLFRRLPEKCSRLRVVFGGAEAGRGVGGAGQAPCHLQVQLAAPILVDQEDGRLLHAVMAEGDNRLFLAADECRVCGGNEHATLEGGAKSGGKFAGRLSRGAGQESEAGVGAEAGERREGFGLRGRQTGKVAQEELDHIGARRTRAQGRAVPSPAALPVVVVQDAFAVQGLHEFDGKERVAPGDAPDRFGEIRDIPGAGPQHVADQGGEHFGFEVVEDHRGGRARMLRGIPQKMAERMGGIDFVAAEQADEQHAVEIVVAKERGEQVESRTVGPLQIIEHEHKRLFGRSDRAEETHEQRGEAALRLGRIEPGRRREPSGQCFQFGENVTQGSGFPAEPFAKALPERAQVFLRFGKQKDKQLPRRLERSEEGAFPPELLALAAHETSPGQRDRAVEFVDQRRFADTRLAAEEKGIQAAACRRLERGDQRMQRMVASDQTVRHARLHEAVSRKERHLVERPCPDQRLFQPAQIVGEARRALVAVVGFLGEKAQDDRGNGGWQPGRELVRRMRCAREMRVNQSRAVGPGEWRGTGRQRVKRGAQRIKVRAVIDRAVHAPGLLRRNIGGTVGQLVERSEARRLFVEGDSVAEPRQHHVAVAQPQVFGTDIAVRDAAFVDRCDDFRQTRGGPEESNGIRRRIAEDIRAVAGPAGIHAGQILQALPDARDAVRRGVSRAHGWAI